MNSVISQNKNQRTVRKTCYDVKVLKRFLAELGEPLGIEDITPTKLNVYLGQFFISDRTKEGLEYEPATLKAYQASIKR